MSANDRLHQITEAVARLDPSRSQAEADVLAAWTALDYCLSKGDGALPDDWQGSTYSLSELRNSTGFRPGARFREV